MERFTIEYYQGDHPGRSFPWFEPLDADGIRSLRLSLAGASVAPADADYIALHRHLFGLSRPVPGADALADGFDLSAVRLRRLGCGLRRSDSLRRPIGVLPVYLVPGHRRHGRLR